MFLIDPRQVKKGDIFLTRNNSRESELIRKVSNSDYSHCILYVGESSCIESDGLGVQAQNLQRIIFENRDDVLVLRLIEEVSKDKIDEIISFARQKIGTEYSVTEARLASFDQKKNAIEGNKQFCTRFVAQAYNEAGFKIVSNSDYCTPKEIQSSHLLVAINNVMKPASESEERLAKENNPPLEKQAEIHNYIFEKARIYTKRDIQTFDQLTQHLLDNPNDDYLISKILKDSGFLMMWQTDIERNPWLYYEDIFRSRIRPEEWRELATDRVRDEPLIRERFIQNKKGYEHCYQFWHQEYFKLLIGLYDHLIKLSEQRENVASKILLKIK